MRPEPPREHRPQRVVRRLCPRAGRSRRRNRVEEPHHPLACVQPAAVPLTGQPGSPPIARASIFRRSISSRAGPHPLRSSPTASSDPSRLQLQGIHRSAAVDGDDLTRDEARHRTAEKEGEVRDVGSMTLQPKGILGPVVTAGHSFGEAPDPLGTCDRSGRDCVDPDSVGAPLDGASTRASESTPAFAAATRDWNTRPSAGTGH